MMSRLALSRGASRAVQHAARAHARRTLFASVPRRSTDVAAALAKEDEESLKALGESTSVVDRVVNAFSLNTWKGFLPLSIIGLVSMGELGWVSVDAELNIAFLMVLFTSTVYDVAGDGFRRDTLDARLNSLREINSAEDTALASLTASRDAHKQVIFAYDAMKTLQTETMRVAELQSEVSVRRARHAVRDSIMEQLQSRVDREARLAADLKAQIVSQTVASVSDYFATSDERVVERLQRNGMTLACASMAEEGEKAPLPVTDEELRDVSNVIDPVDLAYLSVLSHRTAAAHVIMQDRPALVRDELPVLEKLLHDLRADVTSRLPEGANVDDVALLPVLMPTELAVAEGEEGVEQAEMYDDDGEEVLEEADRVVDGYDYEEEEDDATAAEAGDMEDDYSAEYVEEYYDVDYDEEEEGVEVANVVDMVDVEEADKA